MTYSLPNKNHDVVSDIEQLAQTISQIDEDISNLETRTSAVLAVAGEVENTIIHSEQITNSEITNIAPGRFLIVNNEGNGFTCVDGGGTSGGKTGQCIIKRTDTDYDTIYGDIWSTSRNGITPQMNEENGVSNCFEIFCDESEIENTEQFPKVNSKTIQATQDLKIEGNSSVVLKNEIEDVNEVTELATNQNYGFVKVGTGIGVENGVISTEIITTATKSRTGYVKVGKGINVEDGVISVAEIDAATRETKGVVKIGSDFELNENGELELTDMADASIIYKLDQIKNCENGNVDLEEKKLIYRLTITSDIAIQINVNFMPTQDYTFILELLSDGTHLIAFVDQFKDGMTELPINRGTTKLKISKKLGVPYYEAIVYRHDASEPINLTPTASEITSEYKVSSPQGGNRRPIDLLRTYYDGYSDIKELQFDFETLVCVDYVNYLSRTSSVAMGEFVLKGSNDGKNWTTLLYRNNEIVYGKVYTEVKGCFRHYNLKIGYTSADNQPAGVTLWGTQIDNNESELTILTPLMSSNITSFATFTSSKMVENSANQLTDEDWGSRITIGYDANQNRWAQYELATPAVANVLSMYFYNSNLQTNWFTLMGSNDGETWNLLLERQYPVNTLFNNQYRVMTYNFRNETEYKYYRLNCLGTNDANENWYIYGFKLYRRNRGKHNFYRGVPKLSSANQDGYEVTGSSQWDNGSAPYYAFDDDKATRWVAAANEGISWLQIKLPSATVCNVARITSRPESVDVNQAPTSFEIQGSNDGETWDTLTSQSGVTWTSAGETQSFNFSDNETAYLYYRLYITANGGGPAHALAEFVIGRSAYEYKRYLDKYEYLVPVMSANSQNGYVVSAKSNWGSHYPWKAFDRSVSNSDDAWECNDSDRADSNGNCDTWLQIQLPEAKVVNALYLQERNGKSTRDPKDFTLQASNNGTTWTTLLAQTDQSYTDKAWEFDNDVAYLYYRLCITKSNQASDNVCVGIMNLLYHEIITEY